MTTSMWAEAVTVFTEAQEPPLDFDPAKQTDTCVVVDCPIGSSSFARARADLDDEGTTVIVSHCVDGRELERFPEGEWTRATVIRSRDHSVLFSFRAGYPIEFPRR